MSKSNSPLTDIINDATLEALHKNKKAPRNILLCGAEPEDKPGSKPHDLPAIPVSIKYEYGTAFINVNGDTEHTIVLRGQWINTHDYFCKLPYRTHGMSDTDFDNLATRATVGSTEDYLYIISCFLCDGIADTLINGSMDDDTVASILNNRIKHLDKSYKDCKALMYYYAINGNDIAKALTLFINSMKNGNYILQDVPFKRIKKYQLFDKEANKTFRRNFMEPESIGMYRDIGIRFDRFNAKTGSYYMI